MKELNWDLGNNVRFCVVTVCQYSVHIYAYVQHECVRAHSHMVGGGALVCKEGIELGFREVYGFVL